MGIKIGDIDVVSEIIELNYQLLRTQLILEILIRNNPNLTGLTQIELQDIDQRAFESIQQKYPSMGIVKK
jgi:hypothetical protein